MTGGAANECQMGRNNMVTQTLDIRSIVAAWAMVLVPALSWAQGSGITGVVRDRTGSVLPGVSVEAASPALIEKVRTTVSDGQGLYRLLDLRPGVYTLTF